jgi:hypothetical protein
MRLLRIIAAVIFFFLAVLCFRQSVWYDQHLDAIIRIPFVFGAAIIGMLVAGVGIRLLLPK